MELKAIDDSHWARYRIQWADFRNANRGKKDKAVKPQDLIKLSFDDLVNDNIKTPDIDAIKKQFGSKVKKKKNGK